MACLLRLYSLLNISSDPFHIHLPCLVTIFALVYRSTNGVPFQQDDTTVFTDKIEQSFSMSDLHRTGQIEITGHPIERQTQHTTTGQITVHACQTDNRYVG